MVADAVVITAAGCVAAWGTGSHRAPPRLWPAAGTGNPPAFTWSSLFATPCPRFGRMDPLSKLGVAAAEMMGVDFAGRTPGERESVGVCLGTPEGSLSVDVEVWRTRGSPGGPAPALFTYTLPSASIGEICIRYGLKGPNLCLMLSAADSGRLLRESVEWLERGEAGGVVCVFARAVDAGAAVVGAPAGMGSAGAFAGALYLERPGTAADRGRPVLRRVTPADGDVPAIVESLCGAPPAR